MFLDNIVYINENEYIYLKESLEYFLKSIYLFDSVDAAYITCYNSESCNGNVSISILLNCDEDTKLSLLIKGFNTISNLISPKNTRFHFSCDNVNNFFSNSNDGINKIRLEELLSSKILFDKTGNITDLYSNLNDYKFEYSLDVTEFIPPIDEELVKSLKM